MATELNFDLYITANSPGEISGWVEPVVREIRPRIRNVRITLVIVPCQYASGSEIELGGSIGVDRVVSIGSINSALREDKDLGIMLRSGGRRLVMHLGGDFFFSVYLSRKIRASLWAYCSKPRWGRSVERFFVPDDIAARKFAILDFPPERYERIGYIALDSAVPAEDESETRDILQIGQDEPVIAFLTGSRPIEYTRAIPYFAKAACALSERFPDHRMIFPLAPTVKEETLRRTLAENGIEWRGESRVHAICINENKRDESTGWARAVRGRTIEVLNCARFALTLPGTNNLQAAALLTPFIMVLPLDEAEIFPLDGLPGVIPLWIPGVKRLKKKFIMRMNERTDFLSLPNKIAGRMIAPEIRGIFKMQDVIDRAAELLADDEALQRMSRAFWELTHERGASARLAARMAEWAKKDQGV